MASSSASSLPASSSQRASAPHPPIAATVAMVSSHHPQSTSLFLLWNILAYLLVTSFLLPASTATHSPLSCPKYDPAEPTDPVPGSALTHASDRKTSTHADDDGEGGGPSPAPSPRGTPCTPRLVTTAFHSPYSLPPPFFAPLPRRPLVSTTTTTSSSSSSSAVASAFSSASARLRRDLYSCTARFGVLGAGQTHVTTRHLWPSPRRRAASRTATPPSGHPPPPSSPAPIARRSPSLNPTSSALAATVGARCLWKNLRRSARDLARSRWGGGASLDGTRETTKPWSSGQPAARSRWSPLARRQRAWDRWTRTAHALAKDASARGSCDSTSTDTSTSSPSPPVRSIASSSSSSRPPPKSSSPMSSHSTSQACSSCCFSSSPRRPALTLALAPQTPTAFEPGSSISLFVKVGSGRQTPFVLLVLVLVLVLVLSSFLFRPLDENSARVKVGKTSSSSGVIAVASSSIDLDPGPGPSPPCLSLPPIYEKK